MGQKQKSKTPQPQRGPKFTGNKTPRSAPVGRKRPDKKGGNEVSSKAVKAKLFQNSGSTPGKQNAKPGEKRKLDTTLPNHTPGKGKLNTSVTTPAKAKFTPAKPQQTPQQKKPQTPQARNKHQGKTPVLPGKAGKKTPQKPVESDEDEEEDDEDEETMEFEEDSDEDDDDSLEEDMDDDDDDEEDTKALSSKKAAVPVWKKREEAEAVLKKAADDKDSGDDDDSEEEDDEVEDDDDSEDEEDDDSDEEEDDDDDDDEDDDEDDEADSDEGAASRSLIRVLRHDAVLEKIKALRQGSSKLDQKQAAASKQAEKSQSTVAGGKQKQDKSQKQLADSKQTRIKAQKESAAGKQAQQAAAGKKNENKAQKQQSEAKGQAQSSAKVKPDQKTGQSVKLAAPDASGDVKRQEDHDKCTLFVKNLPADVTVSEIKALSKDIREVRLRITIRAKNRQKKKIGYAYIEFASEAIADKNFKALQGAKLKDSEVVVDYVGQKSNYTPRSKEAVDPDPLRLYITGFGSEVNETDLRKLFPKAQEVVIPVRKKDSTPIGYAFVAFATSEQCQKAHERVQGAKIRDHSLVVLYAKKRTEKKKDVKQSQKNKNKEKKTQPPAKKAKREADDDEDDSDDDEDDSDDDNDESEDDASEDADDDDKKEEENDEEEDDDDDDDEED